MYFRNTIKIILEGGPVKPPYSFPVKKICNMEACSWGKTRIRKTPGAHPAPATWNCSIPYSMQSKLASVRCCSAISVSETERVQNLAENVSNNSMLNMSLRKQTTGARIEVSIWVSLSFRSQVSGFSKKEEKKVSGL